VRAYFISEITEGIPTIFGIANSGETGNETSDSIKGGGGRGILD